jgi:hypothetical protein
VNHRKLHNALLDCHMHKPIFPTNGVPFKTQATQAGRGKGDGESVGVFFLSHETFDICAALNLLFGTLFSDGREGGQASNQLRMTLAKYRDLAYSVDLWRRFVAQAPREFVLPLAFVMGSCVCKSTCEGRSQTYVRACLLTGNMCSQTRVRRMWLSRARSP